MKHYRIRISSETGGYAYSLRLLLKVRVVLSHGKGGGGKYPPPCCVG